jgi:sortase A
MDPRNKWANDDSRDSNRDAAARLVRDQLDAIYSREPKIKSASGDSHTHTTRPKHHQDGHQQHSQQHQQHHHKPQTSHGTGQSSLSDEDLTQYHNQWQEYYQKYYENYYVGHLHQAIKEHEKETIEPEEKQKEEIKDLRAKIVTKAKTKAKKAKKSRHFVPIISAAVVVSIVAFLQYNQVIIGTVQAYVSPGAINPNNIVIDPTKSTQVTAEPRLIIPKINVDVPVVYNVGYDHASQMNAMSKGVAHFAIPGADSVPGQLGNAVFSGHSSNDLFDSGDYKFIFAQLDKLKTGDTIFLHYESTRYTYTVTETTVVKPNNVGALLGKEDKPYVTLITCTPLGTALNRLLVYAEQVAPDPSKAKPVNTESTGTGDAVMAGNSPTVIERLFGAR